MKSFNKFNEDSDYEKYRKNLPNLKKQMQVRKIIFGKPRLYRNGPTEMIDISFQVGTQKHHFGSIANRMGKGVYYFTHSAASYLWGSNSKVLKAKNFDDAKKEVGKEIKMYIDSYRKDPESKYNFLKSYGI